MEKKKKRNFFALTIVSVLLFVVAIFASGFIFLDKVIIPKYFGVYQINNLNNLFGVVSSLYASPDEDELVNELKLTRLVTPHLNITDPVAPAVIAAWESLVISDVDNLVTSSSDL